MFPYNGGPLWSVPFGLLDTSSIICQEKKVRKLYLALAAAPVPIGILTHYMRPINMAPRLVSRGKQVAIIFCLRERDKNRQREKEPDNVKIEISNLDKRL